MRLYAKSTSARIRGAVAFVALFSPTVGQAQYGTCPDPVASCIAFHGLGSTATNFCKFEECFDMNYGTELRVTVADQQGPFPKEWHVWHSGSLSPAGSCILERSGNKTEVSIPVNAIRCQTTQTTSNGVYYQHFVSNPTSACLAWLECAPPPNGAAPLGQ